MKQILLFGAGKSATVLIEYLLQQAAIENWHITVVDAVLEIVQQKTGHSPMTTAASFDIKNDAERATYIQEADIVLSMMPPALHLLIAKDCVKYKKNLLTASYIDEEMRLLQKDIEDNGLLFLCEMGLDPGIDHMSAKKLIDSIEQNGSIITSFKSHCGGLVAPESDDNPWHYKISWNPRNVITAGKSGAIYKEKDIVQRLAYKQIFEEQRYVSVPNYGELCWYPNRNSLSYLDIYGLKHCHTFIRTTLRHPDFISGWKNIIELKLTDEKSVFDSDDKTLMQFFKVHMEANGFSSWLQDKLQHQLSYTKTLLENLMKLVDAEEKAATTGEEALTDFLIVDDKGDLQDMTIEEVKTSLASEVADKMQEANRTVKQLFYLGFDDDETKINKGLCSAADVLQLALEKKLALQPHDKDLVIMKHELEYTQNNISHMLESWLIVKGNDQQHTAMAKTVGLPLGIAAKLILNNTISLKGLHIPIHQAIYEPVLDELAKHDIVFHEQTHIVK